MVTCNPSKIAIAGRGSAFQELNRLVIPENMISVSGAMEDITQIVNISSILPDGVRFADREFDGNVEVYVQIEPMLTIDVEVPVENISIINIPAGYTAHLVETAPKRIEIQGISTALIQVNPAMITGTIDASSLSPRMSDPDETGEGSVHTGSNDGLVVFTVPTGISAVGQVYMEVILSPIGTQEGDKTE